MQLKSSQGKILNATQNKHQMWQMPQRVRELLRDGCGHDSNLLDTQSNVGKSSMSKWCNSF